MDPSGLDHAANAALCRYFKGRGRTDLPALARPDEVPKPYETLGTHPDLAARLWDEIAARLPADCRFIVFGFAGGTHTYALRLPEVTRQEAVLAGAERVKKYPLGGSLDLDDFGPE